MRSISIVASFLCLSSLLTSQVPLVSATCGYASCPKLKEGAINVHLVPHTHDDVGWLKTVDQYYYGEKTGIQRAGVQYILNTVIDELEKDPNRRFIYVETEFFHQWWRKQTDEKRNQVKDLVQQGRLEFIGGGWTMNDEAAAHYISIIDQMTLGHRFLRKEFGTCGIPKVAWQIDPFGHAREQASLFAHMGFDGLFFGRLDWQEKQAREKNLTMETVWVASTSMSKKSSSLFTGVLPNGYMPPAGFCFDDTCEDSPIIDSPDSVEYNVPQKVQQFLEHVKNQSEWYASSNLIMTMGSDFQYQNANPWFENLDKLINYVNSFTEDVNLMYSTPSCYLKALNDANLTWPTKSDDFFPYSSDPHAFWGGYFSSRPAFKRHERESSAFLQTCKQLQVMAGLTGLEDQAKLGALADAVAISQHHDAITGTEKQLVYSDYVRRLAAGEKACVNLTIEAIKVIESKKADNGQASINLDTPMFVCRALNVSECAVSEQLFDPSSNDKLEMQIVIYNQLGRFRVESVRVPLVNPVAESLSLLNATGGEQSFNLQEIPQEIRNLPERNSNATHELEFAAHLDALSITSYTLIQTAAIKPTNSKRNSLKFKASTPTTLTGNGFTLNLDSKTSLPISVTLTESGKTVDFEHSLRYYPAHAGDNSKFDKRASGAYIFRPNTTESLPIADSDQVSVTFKQYGNWQVLELNYSLYAFESIRVHPRLDFIEFDYLVGPIPVDDKIGKEVVADYSTNINSTKLFSTDSNGRQNIVRQRNHRDTYSYDSSVEPVASNYYPINARAALKDAQEDVELTILVDRSCGGSSLRDGQLELMLHRRLLNDDAFGVGEPLNEPGTDGRGLIIRGRQWVHIGSHASAIEFGRKRTQELTLPPLILFGEPQKPSEKVQNGNRKWKSSLLHESLTDALPDGAHLLTVESFPDDRVMVRVENYYEKGERVDDDIPVRVDLRKIFDTKVVGTVNAVYELNLSANHVKGTIKRLVWKTDDGDDDGDNPDESRNDVGINLEDLFSDKLDQKMHRRAQLKMYRKYFQSTARTLEEELFLLDKLQCFDFIALLYPMQIRTYMIRIVR